MRSRSSERAPPATRISPDMPETVIFWKSTFCSSVLSERFKLRGTSSACADSAEVPADDGGGDTPPAGGDRSIPDTQTDAPDNTPDAP